MVIRESSVVTGESRSEIDHRPSAQAVLTSRAGTLRLGGGAPHLVGILNVTPDSFYDGGRHADAQAAVQAGMDLFAEGAAWVDVGGMSTRPGAAEIPVEEEIRRVEPVIAGMSSAAGGRAWISIDTYRAEVARRALDAGAACVNDVSGFSLDPEMIDCVASAKCPVVINHMKGAPRTMQDHPAYDSVWDELLRFFEDRLGRFVKAGGDESLAVLDPGIGFGKTLEHNLDILRHLDRLHVFGRPIFLGCSRKSFIQHLMSPSSPAFTRLPQPSPDMRLPGSLAAAASAALHGAHLLRVHDVAQTAQFLKVFMAVAHA